VGKGQDRYEKDWKEDVLSNDATGSSSSTLLNISFDGHAGNNSVTRAVARNACKREQEADILGGRVKMLGITAMPFPTDVDVLMQETGRNSSFTSDQSLHFADYPDISNSLKVALPFVVKSTDMPRLFHPTTSHGLLRKMIKITTFKPLPSFSRLLKFHDAYISLHSTKTFNYLIQHAIRHTDYTTANKLLQRMLQEGLCFDTETRTLRIRLMVRKGDRIRALKMIKRDMSNGLEVSPELWIELLGYIRPVRAGNGDVDENTSKRDGKVGEINLPEDGWREWKEHLLESLSKTCLHIQSTRVLDRFAFTAVQHLLRESETHAAQMLTKQWLSRIPPRPNQTRTQRCLDVLHLHLAHSAMGVKGHIVAREFVKEFLQLCPGVKPNSSTLFLLLRSLKRTCVNGTAVALSSVDTFEKKWGSTMVDRRVRRRVVAIALKEGKFSVARQWLAVEERLSRANDSEVIERQVAGAQQSKIPGKYRKLPMRRYMLGQDAENRKWIWVKRRYARALGGGADGTRVPVVDE